MLTILEAMGVFALLTREMPTEVAAKRKLLRKIWKPRRKRAQSRSEWKRRHRDFESRITQLPKELETGLDLPRIAKLLGESLRQCLQRSGLSDTGLALSQSCAE